MIKVAIGFILSVGIATSVVADDCVYINGVGPSIVIVGERDALDVDFGDWIERCALTVSERRPDLGFGSGWTPAWIARCDNFSTQVAFVAPRQEGEQTIIVFDGNVFYRDCETEQLRTSSGGG